MILFPLSIIILTLKADAKFETMFSVEAKLIFRLLPNINHVRPNNDASGIRHLFPDDKTTGQLNISFVGWTAPLGNLYNGPFYYFSI